MTELVSITHTLAKFHITEMELAHHLGVNKRTIQQWDRGNLEMSLTAQRLLAVLVEVWDKGGYEKPEEMWGV